MAALDFVSVVGFILIVLVSVGVATWMAGAIYFDLCGASRSGALCAVAWGALVVAGLTLWQPAWQPFLALSGLFALFLVWWFSQRPSNEREWNPNFAVLPRIEVVGDRVTIHAGACIGEPGFGFAPDPTGHVKVPQIGRVIIHDEARIGANTTIDRGTGPDTVIGPGCMIDNLVQIGHNVQLGRGCIVVGQVGISGSTRIDEFVVLAGQVGVAGHLEIGKGAIVAAKSGVTHGLPGGETYGGIPAVPVKQWRRQVAALARLARPKRKGPESDG